MIQNFISNPDAYLQGPFILVYLIVYLSGVLISFTLCVCPVTPITVAYIGAHGSGSKLRGFLLPIVYILGMAITYKCLGGFAALSSRLFEQIQKNP